jgi:hypothetical protein
MVPCASAAPGEAVPNDREGIAMKGSVWILDRHEDNLGVVIDALGRAGVPALAFTTPESLLVHAQVRHGHAVERPRAAIIDARTGAGSEYAIREAIGSRLIILTTWPPQIRPWLAVGVSRFLFKPYTTRALLDQLDPAAGVIGTAGVRRCAAAQNPAA